MNKQTSQRLKQWLAKSKGKGAKCTEGTELTATKLKYYY